MRSVGIAAVVVVVAGLLSGAPAATGAAVTCDGRTATIVGSNGNDKITGTSKADVIAALAGDDRIEGLAGDDVICGGDGADQINAGYGDDRVFGGRDRIDSNAAGSFLVGDVLDGGPGADLLAPGYDSRKVAFIDRPDTFWFANADSGVRVDLSGTTKSSRRGLARGTGQDVLAITPRMRVVGSPQADVITGSSDGDVLVGGGGADQIDGRGGRDRIFPDEESPSTTVTGNDLVSGGGGSDFVSSLAGRDQINTGGGNDRVEAFSPDPSVVKLGRGNDYLGQHVTTGDGASANGGDGHDVLMLYAAAYAGRTPSAEIGLDLRTGAVTAPDRTVPDSTGTVAGFEGYRFADDARWRFIGSSAGEAIWVIDGGGLVARMRGGNDRVVGSPRDDLINGGHDRDSAYGREGVNRCIHVEVDHC